ncbi:MAG: MMPL family transporter, partial [Bacteroidales bacterium]|nr:MMPL family transporter [Bacteroidales bacterium]
MRKTVLAIYDFFSARKWLAGLLLCVLLALCALSALRIEYEEDINAFLPKDSESKKYTEIYGKLGSSDRIAVFFSPKEDSDSTEDDVEDAMLEFGACLEALDSDSLVKESIICTDESALGDAFSFICSNWPLFMRPEDYARADSLLNTPGYRGEKLAQLKLSLMSPFSSYATDYWKSDPLGIFQPVLGRLAALRPASSANVRDGFLFAADGKTGIAFAISPFGGSESGNNAAFVSLVKQAEEQTSAKYPAIEIFSTGGPEVAVENASRIKKDSFLALGIAVLLICIVLWLSYKRFADVVWIVVSILAGSAFALGLVALFRPSLSVIILGIGSMITGIAANYPLHYVDHLK